MGSKRSSGNAIERAGLAGGKLYGIAVIDGGSNYLGGAVAMENNGAIHDGTFSLVDVTAPPAQLQSGAALQARSMSAGVTSSQNPKTAIGTRNILACSISSQPAHQSAPGADADLAVVQAYVRQYSKSERRHDRAGGRQQGSDWDRWSSAQWFDNMTVDGEGHVILQEDPGSSAYIAKVWDVDPHKPLEASQAFEFDRDRFETGAPNFLTVDEETSGVIDVTSLVTSAWWFAKGRRYYLGVVQAHYPNGTTLVEGGQFYIMVGPAKGHKHGHDHDGDDDRGIPTIRTRSKGGGPASRSSS